MGSSLGPGLRLEGQVLGLEGQVLGLGLRLKGKVLGLGLGLGGQVLVNNTDICWCSITVSRLVYRRRNHGNGEQCVQGEVTAILQCRVPAS